MLDPASDLRYSRRGQQIRNYYAKQSPDILSSSSFESLELQFKERDHAAI